MTAMTALIMTFLVSAVIVGAGAKLTKIPKPKGVDGSSDDGAEGARMAAILVVMLVAMAASAIWRQG